jgi:hypothetical protein
MYERQLARTSDGDLGGAATKLIAASLILVAVAAPLASSLIDAFAVTRTAVEPSSTGGDAAPPDGASRLVPSGAPASPATATVPPPPAAAGAIVVADPSGAPRADVDGPSPTAEPASAISPYAGTVPAPRTPDGTWRVLYVGDSLAYETEQHVRSLLAGDDVELMTFGGTAPCDWVDRVIDHAVAAGPDLVVISFLGNNITPCTGNAVGQPLLDAYERDLTNLCAAVSPARCVLVGQPTVPIEVGWNMPAGDQPTTMYRAVAEDGRWGFVDAGAAVETADGGFDPVLRNEDLVHFSEDGARLYAETIAGFVEQIRA